MMTLWTFDMTQVILYVVLFSVACCFAFPSQGISTVGIDGPSESSRDSVEWSQAESKRKISSSIRSYSVCGTE